MITFDPIRTAQPDPSGTIRTRAVRPNGAVIIEDLAINEGNAGAFYGYPVGIGQDRAIGEYEWQQFLNGEWVTLSRYKVTAP